MINNHSTGTMTDSPKIIPEVSASDEIRYRSDGDTKFQDPQTVIDSIK
ncbi:MAG: hypothetical protein KAH32_00500 [Chlamydiia bacterium]|nr:hypothetical protein [Chlamydiia bacterium]